MLVAPSPPSVCPIKPMASSFEIPGDQFNNNTDKIEKCNTEYKRRGVGKREKFVK